MLTQKVNSEFKSALASGLGKWRGCCWPTEFGSRRLNLQDLKSSQAALMARSTAGQEAAAWRAAAQWLEKVERDAARAEKQAKEAASLAEAGDLERALTLAEGACRLESNYKIHVVWQPLRDAIAATLERNRTRGPGNA